MPTHRVAVCGLPFLLVALLLPAVVLWSDASGRQAAPLLAEVDDTATPTPAPSATATPRPGDSDGDGCTAAEEAAMGFDDTKWHDFYDVPVPVNPDPTPNGSRNRGVTMGDVLAVLFYSGTSENGPPNSDWNVDYDSDKNGDTVGDGRDYDRSWGPEPDPPWDAGPPDGNITILTDVLLVLTQVGLDCEGQPGPAASGGPNAMAVDANPATPGVIDAAVTGFVGYPFQVSVNITQATSGYQGYDLLLEYDDSKLIFVPTSDLSGDTVPESWDYTGLLAPGYHFSARVTQAGERLQGGAAYLVYRPGEETRATGQAVLATFECVTEGTGTLHLVSSAENPVAYSNTLLPGGAPITTTLTDAAIICSSDTPTPAPTPTVTLTPTITPTPTFTPTPCPPSVCHNTIEVIPADSGGVAVGGSFIVELYVTEAELSYMGVQAQLEWDAAALEHVSNTSDGTILQFRAPANLDSGDPPGTEQIVVGGMMPVPVNVTGLIWTVTLRCDAEGVYPLHLVPLSEDVYGTYTNLIPGTPQPMVLEDGQVDCGGPTPSPTITPTPSITPTPTATPTPTPTPTITPTPTPTATPTPSPPPGADLVVILNDNPNAVFAGAPVTYWGYLTNNGPNDAQNVVFTDPLPGEVTFVSATASQGSCSEDSGTVTCNLGGLADGATAYVTVDVTADPGLADGTAIVNAASVGSDTPDAVPGNNTASTRTGVGRVFTVRLCDAIADPECEDDTSVGGTPPVTTIGQWPAGDLLADMLGNISRYFVGYAGPGWIIKDDVDIPNGTAISRFRAAIDSDCDGTVELVGASDEPGAPSTAYEAPSTIPASVAPLIPPFVPVRRTEGQFDTTWYNRSHPSVSTGLSYTGVVQEIPWAPGVRLATAVWFPSAQKPGPWCAASPLTVESVLAGFSGPTLVAQNPLTPGLYVRWFTFESRPHYVDGHRNRVVETHCFDIGSSGLPDADEDCLADGDDPNPAVFDTDVDGLSDGVEVAWGSDPLMEDTDGDGLSDFDEIFEFSNPKVPDSDADGVLDANDNCPFHSNPLQENQDGEFERYKRGDACDQDDDNDNLLDTLELGPFKAPGSSPGLAVWVCIWPEDEFYDRFAVPEIETDPANPDTDGDGFLDGSECIAGSNPIDSQSVPELCDSLDNDLDGRTDEECEQYSTGNPWDDPAFNCPPSGAPMSNAGDNDDDGLKYGRPRCRAPSMSRESRFYTSDVRTTAGFVHDLDGDTLPGWDDPDSDNDGLNDGFEALRLGTSPSNPDTDGDGIGDADEDPDGDCLPNWAEQAAGTYPRDPDTDDDGILDGPCGSEDLNGNGVVDPGETDPTKADTDGDGLSDGLERGLAAPEGAGTDTADPDYQADADPASTTDPTNADSDGDGVADGAEDANANGAVDSGEGSPSASDTDSDGEPDSTDNCPGDANSSQDDGDGDEVGDACDAFPSDPTETADTDGDGIGDNADPDADNDWLTNDDEDARGTNPTSADTDGDGLDDGAEVNTLATSPLARDTDDDGLWDGAEANGLGTDPTEPDTDGDGLTDGNEVLLFETEPTVPDSDADGLSDGDEPYTESTVPTDPDTDGDGLSDGAEVNIYHTDPLHPDKDADGVNDGVEIAMGTDPHSPDSFVDSDGDGVFDVIDNCALTPNPDQTDTDSDHLGDLCDPCPDDLDCDDDGCSDGEELASNPIFGGQRDPLNPYDFYDVPVPTAFNGPGGVTDKAVTILNDVLAVLEYAGTMDGGACNNGPDGIRGTGDDRCYNQDNNSDGQPDGILYDRSAGPAWSDAPDGAITILEDVLLVLAQSGHGCAP